MRFVTGIIVACTLLSSSLRAQMTPAPARQPPAAPEEIIIDTDIGSDIDDAFRGKDLRCTVRSSRFSALPAPGGTHTARALAEPFPEGNRPL